MASSIVCANVVSTYFQTHHLKKRNCPKFRQFPTESFLSSSLSSSAAIRFDSFGYNTNISRNRGLVVAGAGPPSTTNLIFAFVFPLSLLIVTIFTSIRIAEKLDKEYLEELAINEAIMEEEEDEDGEVLLPAVEEPALPQSRNRPKREA